jgi:hypothetical protein
VKSTAIPNFKRRQRVDDAPYTREIDPAAVNP